MKRKLLLLITVAALSLSLPVHADDVAEIITDYPDSWHFHMGAYAWFSGANGFFKIKTHRATADLPLSQVRQHLDFGGQGFFEAYRYNWTLILDPSYIHFTENAYVDGKRAKISQGTVTIDAGAYYLLLSQKCPEQAYTQATLELLLAGRIMTFHSTIHYYDTITKSNADGSGFLVPILGARVKYRFNPKTYAWVNGDFGGFKISYVNSTWSTMLGVGHEIAKGWDLNFAYKLLGVNYSKTAMTNVMLFQGPLLGLSYSW